MKPFDKTRLYNPNPLIFIIGMLVSANFIYMLWTTLHTMILG